ncbi:MAG: PIN domain-containing protein [Bacteroidales bacterium]|nr:PIN domain-containing protein [Bacteroidales bacterium]
MLDTCVVVDMLYDCRGLDKKAIELLQDYSCTLYASFETLRELVVLFNNNKIRSKEWKKAGDVIQAVKNDLDIHILPLSEEVADTYANLVLNETLNHYDPSDHIIISQAITEKIPLISSDLKFPFYREQGLDLIEC